MSSLILNPCIQNKHLIRDAFGWNFKLWAKPFKEIDFSQYDKPVKVLELGASKYSMMGLVFDGIADEIVISYYDEAQRNDIIQKLKQVKKNHTLHSDYKIEKIDANNAKGDYNVVVMKSVLGGLFRKNTNNLNKFDDFLNNLLLNATKYNGVLITIDNGVSIYENILSNFGARKNNWHFFYLGEIQNSVRQFKFGLISSFSFETRLKWIGYFLDNLFYYLDIFLSKLWPYHPSVIVSIFKNNNAD